MIACLDSSPVKALIRFQGKQPLQPAAMLMATIIGVKRRSPDASKTAIQILTVLGCMLAIVSASSGSDAGHNHRNRETGASKANQAPRCICAFDFDLTLRVPRATATGVNQDGPVAEAPAVMQQCLKARCFIGIASANHNTQKLQRVLQRNYGTGVFSSDFFKSQAFQTGRADKSISLRRLAVHFNSTTSCLVLFDDSEFNRKYANNVGDHFEHVDSKTGVQLWNFYSAMNALPSWCTGRQLKGR